MNEKKEKTEKDVGRELKKLETIAGQTVVHRKKFEYTMSLLRKFYDFYFSSVESVVPRFSVQATAEILAFFQEILSLISQNVISTWTVPTIGNEPNYVQEQLLSIFERFSIAMQKYGPEFKRELETKPEDWSDYNILDLSAISASFSVYLKTEGINPSIFKKVTIRLQSINDFLLQNSSQNLTNMKRVFSPIPVVYRQWHVDYEDFIFLKQIGKGISANVFRGIYKKTNEEVAIKKFLFKKLNSAIFQTYQREVAVLATAQHPCLLRLIGATDEEPFCIATEWMGNGTLLHGLHNVGFMTQMDRSIAAYDIARGMQYLHSLNIVHRDLKSGNVLLDKNKRVKICDFAFSRFAEDGTQMTHNLGTVHWMAPEILKPGSSYTSKVDVYAYGIVLWELATSEIPYPNLVPFDIIDQVLNNDARPQLPPYLNPKMKDLITMCWDRNPKVRPSFNEIVAMIQNNVICFDGTNVIEFQNYMKSSATATEILTGEYDKRIAQLQKNEISLSEFNSFVEKEGLQHDVVEKVWDIISQIEPKDGEYLIYSNLLSKFFSSSKMSQVTNLLLKLPKNSIPYAAMIKFISEVPTGSSDVDHKLCIIACKNNCASLSSLYCTNSDDVALSLEVCSINGVDEDLKVSVSDKCIQSLSSNNDNLVCAALRCLITIGDYERIKPYQLEAFITRTKSELIRNISYVIYTKLCDENSAEVTQELIEYTLNQFGTNKICELFLLSACNNASNSQLILNSLFSLFEKEESNPFKVEFISSLYIKLSTHSELIDKLKDSLALLKLPGDDIEKIRSIVFKNH